MYGEKQIISPNSSHNTFDKSTAAQPSLFTEKKKSFFKTDLLDIAAIFFGFFSVYFLVTFVFMPKGYAVTATYLSFLLFTTVYIVSKQKRIPLKAVFPLCLSVLLSLCYSIHNMFTLSFLIPVLIYLSGYYCLCLTETQGFLFDGYISIYEQIKAVVFIPLGKLHLPLQSLWQNRKKGFSGQKNFGIIIGIFCGIPVFITVANLLIEGDAAFSQIMEGFSDKSAELLNQTFEKIFEHIDPFYLIISLIFAPYIISTVFSFRHGVIKEKLQNSRTRDNVKSFRFVSSGVLGGFYGIVALCYVLYLVSQFSYLFGAFSGKMPLSVDISLSDYARRGFFEMSAVAFINLCLIGAGALFSKRDEKDNLPRLYKVFSIFFCLFTILLVVTAMSKMGLYITELGLTHKRILVSIADIILLVTFVCVLIKIFKDNFPYMKITMITALIFVTVYFVVSPDFMISQFNTRAYLSGHHKNIDIHTIAYLDDNYQAAMGLERLTQSKNEVVAAFAKNELYDCYRMYTYTEKNDDNKVYNLAEKKLVKFFKENKKRIEGYKRFGYYDVNYEYDIDKLMEEAEKSGELFEIKTTELTFIINTQEDVDGVYFENPYSSFYGMDSIIEQGLSSVTFSWDYSSNPEDNFASVQIEKDSNIYDLKIKLPQNDENYSEKAVTYIEKYSMTFELRDSEDGGFVLIEV